MLPKRTPVQQVFDGSSSPRLRSCAKAANYLRDARPQIAKWRSNADFTSVGQDLLRVRPRVQAAAALLAANVDPGSATLLNRAAESALYSMDAADVALGFAIRETNTRYVITRAAAAADALDTADADYCELARFVDALYPETKPDKKKLGRTARRWVSTTPPVNVAEPSTSQSRNNRFWPKAAAAMSAAPARPAGPNRSFNAK